MLGAEVGEDLEGSVPSGRFCDWVRSGRLCRFWFWLGFGRRELDAADIKILFEAIQLEQVGKLESSHVSAPGSDLALEVSKDSLEIAFVKAGVEEFVPEAFPVKAQAHALAGQAAVERVSLLDALDHDW